jgi:hypothetical protein
VYFDETLLLFIIDFVGRLHNFSYLWKEKGRVVSEIMSCRKKGRAS